jgi:hypothetical protein
MKLRSIKNHVECESTSFNIFSLSEIIIYYAGGDADSAPISDFVVFLESTRTWKYMPDAFGDRDLIPDGLNSHFREPVNDRERKNGYY